MKTLLLVIALLLVSCECQRAIAWRVPSESEWTALSFGGEGAAEWSEGQLRLDLGVELNGSRFGGELPKLPYELELKARRLSGSDFFCGLTFPVRSPEECLTLILGGWGGGTVGLSSIDGKDASENDSTFYRNFENQQWYAIQLRVLKERIEVRLDGELVITQPTAGKTLGLRPGMIHLCAPLGLAAWQTEAEFKGLRWRSITD